MKCLSSENNTMHKFSPFSQFERIKDIFCLLTRYHFTNNFRESDIQYQLQVFNIKGDSLDV